MNTIGLYPEEMQYSETHGESLTRQAPTSDREDEGMIHNSKHNTTTDLEQYLAGWDLTMPGKLYYVYCDCIVS